MRHLSALFRNLSVFKVGILSLRIRSLVGHFRHMLVGVSASVLLVALSVGMPEPASASASVQVLNTSTWTESYNGALHVVGEVRNAGSTTIDSVQLQVNYYNASDLLLKTQSIYASMYVLNPGEKSPFVLVDVKPATFDHAVVNFINAWEPKPADYRGLNAVVTNETTDAFNDTTLTGTVTNNSSTPAQRPQMVATFYGLSQVANVAIGYSPKTLLAPGESDTFTVFVGGTLFSSYSLQTQADNRLSAPITTTTTTTVPTSSTTTTAVPMPTTTTTALPAPSLPTAAPKRSGYWMLGSDGAVYAFGVSIR